MPKHPLGQLSEFLRMCRMPHWLSVEGRSHRIETVLEPRLEYQFIGEDKEI